MKLKILLIIGIVFLIVSLFYLYVNRENPLLYRSVDSASVEHSGFIIQNPFRERGPEVEAERILQNLKDGNCKEALTLLAEDANAIVHTCEREGFYPIKSWSIMDREDIGNKVVFVYKVYRNDHGDTIPESTKTFPGLVWIDVEKIGDQFHALSYQTYY